MSGTQDANFRVDLAHRSVIARSRHADTFVWWPTELLACFNNEVLGPVNANDIQRWFQKLMEEPEAMFNVKPVTIEPYNESRKPIQCRPIESSDIVLTPKEVLSPRDYCVYYQDSSKKVMESPTQTFWTFLVPYPTIGNRVRNESKLQDGQCILLDPIPDDLLVNANLRPQSQGSCLLTGSSGPDTITCWILPPSQSCSVSLCEEDRPDDVKRDEAGFTHVANLISMREDLYALFLENAFGVDVEDDFKIRMFHPTAKAVDLPARLHISNPDEHTKYFLDAHFRWCLNAHFHGGSIECDSLLSEQRAWEFLAKESLNKDVGVPVEYKLKKADWETQLGKGIAEFLTFQDPGFEATWVDTTAAEGENELGN